MIAPILVMLSSPVCPAGWYPVPGAQPAPGMTEALALVLPSLYPPRGAQMSEDARAALAACLPPEGFEPEKMEVSGPRDPVTLTERIGGFLFHVAALDFVRMAHGVTVRWAPGGADGFGTITEVDLLHGWFAGRCVAVLGRMAPTDGAVAS